MSDFVLAEAELDCLAEPLDAVSGGKGMNLHSVNGSFAALLRTGPEVGRKKPCPCGSWRKYKHCHGAT